jgi:hypothetical protein
MKKWLYYNLLLEKTSFGISDVDLAGFNCYAPEKSCKKKTKVIV